MMLPAAPHSYGINRVFDAAFDTGWRAFPGPYLLYAATGAFQLEVAAGRWLLPPQRAAWVAADVPLRLSAHGPGTTNSVLFAANSMPPLAWTIRVFAVSALAREMLLHATRWGVEHAHDTTADAFFHALAAVCIELAAQPDLFWLPGARSPAVQQALAYTLDQLSEQLTFAAVARAAYMSERTLARRWMSETGMTWSQFVRRARMIRAMELLAEPNSSITDVLYAVG